VNEGRPFSTTDRELLLDLGFLNVTRRSIESPNGALFSRVVIEHPGAAAVVPTLEDDVILIHQYRAALGARILEIPAGKLDLSGEDTAVAARRELAEETGFVAGTLTHLTDLLTTVGFCDEKIIIFLADEIVPGVREPIGPEEEDAHVVRMPFDEAIDLVASGEIADAKTVVGLLLTARIRATS
jgi:ADP-ribose pyrophosphatase